MNAEQVDSDEENEEPLPASANLHRPVEEEPNVEVPFPETKAIEPTIDQELKEETEETEDGQRAQTAEVPVPLCLEEIVPSMAKEDEAIPHDSVARLTAPQSVGEQVPHSQEDETKRMRRTPMVANLHPCVEDEQTVKVPTTNPLTSRERRKHWWIRKLAGEKWKPKQHKQDLRAGSQAKRDH